MSTVLLDAVEAHAKKKMTSMHMPAHKSVFSALGLAGEFDITEIPDTGSLFDGEGATALAESEAAKLFETRASFMSAGGCTLCIQAMLRAAAPHGGKIICGRVVHRSAINAMSLLGIEPIWVLPDRSAGELFSGRITAEAVTAALEKNPDAKGVYITSPDYFGLISDVRGIAEAARKFGVPLLVDCAHGAHLKFFKDDISPIKLGAALSAESAHKTLPVLTGGAWLQVGDERFVSEIRSAMSLFGSTSPSYPIMISLDLARDWIEQNRSEFLKLAERVEKTKALCRSLGLTLPEGECDPTRITFDVQHFGFDGEDVGNMLREGGIEPEYAGLGKVILIPSVMNTDEDFDRLECVLEKIFADAKKVPSELVGVNAFIPERAMSAREAILAESEYIQVQNAVGRVAAEPYCPCPPAIPAAMPGEVLGEREVLELRRYGILKIKVVK